MQDQLQRFIFVIAYQIPIHWIKQTSEPNRTSMNFNHDITIHTQQMCVILISESIF